MSISKHVMTVKDSVTFTLKEADLTGKENGQHFKTQQRDLPCSDGLKWWVIWYPAGRKIEDRNYISLRWNINKDGPAKYKFQMEGSSNQPFTPCVFEKRQSCGSDKFASHHDLRPLFVGGTLKITCHVEFDVTVPFTLWAPRLGQHCGHVSTDFQLVVGSDQLQVHKCVLSLMSPVLHAMLSHHQTAEVLSGKMVIKDFEFATVKAVIDYCYGREMETPSAETAVDMLRFADKYDIRSVTEQLQNLPRQNLSVDAFPSIVHYADDCSMKNLFKQCCRYFREHQWSISETKKFKMLPPALVVRLLKQSFQLTTDFDVLRHAECYNITFILQALEQPIIESLSLDTFCATANGAWYCSSGNLKNACAKFFNDNQFEIRKMKSFIDLPQHIVYGVLKLGYELL